MTDESIAAGLRLALEFHEIYERMAPSFGYETRPDTKAFDPESKNGRLMTAVCTEILGREVLRASSGSLSEAEERAAFELWITTRWRPDDGAKLMKRDYPSFAFAAWQARAALSPSGPMISLDAALGCVPGGSVCDPQVIADSLRELVAAGPRSPSPDQSPRNTQIDNSRGEFEAFHASRKNKGVSYREHLFDRREDGTYVEDSVQRHWWTWQQARAAHIYGAPENPKCPRHGIYLCISCWKGAALADQSDFRVLKRDEGPTADAATGTGNTQGTEP